MEWIDVKKQKPIEGEVAIGLWPDGSIGFFKAINWNLSYTYWIPMPTKPVDYKEMTGKELYDEFWKDPAKDGSSLVEFAEWLKSKLL